MNEITRLRDLGIPKVTEKKALKKRFPQNTKFKKTFRIFSILDILKMSKNDLSHDKC